MKTLSIICFFILSLTNNIIAQNKEKYPLGDYTELTDTKPHDSNTFWDKQGTLPQLRWGSTDIRYSKLRFIMESQGMERRKSQRSSCPMECQRIKKCTNIRIGIDKRF